MRTALAALLPLCALPTLVACAETVFAGIPLSGGAVDPAIQALARRASTGDRIAQLDLGRRFEEGLGVPRDAAKACAVYTRQAGSSNREQWVWQASSGTVERYDSPAASRRRDFDDLDFKAFLCRSGALQAEAGR